MARPLSPLDSEPESVEVPPQAARARAREAVAAPATVIREIRRMSGAPVVQAPGTVRLRRWLRRRLTRVDLPENPFCPPCYPPVSKDPRMGVRGLPDANGGWRRVTPGGGGRETRKRTGTGRCPSASCGCVRGRGYSVATLMEPSTM